MDRIDVSILSILQKNGQTSMSKLSEMVGLSLSACHRRVKILESEGKIASYAARLDAKAVGLEIQVFIEVKLTSQRQEEIDAFESAIKRMPEVLECHFISGEADYLMRVAARSTSDYERALPGPAVTAALGVADENPAEPLGGERVRRLPSRLTAQARIRGIS